MSLTKQAGGPIGVHIMAQVNTNKLKTLLLCVWSTA